MGCNKKSQTKNKMSDLKPCMCCGKSNRVTIYSTFCYANEEIRNIRFGVKCKRCGIELGTYSKKETAIKRWNTRPAEYAKDREIGRLQAALHSILQNAEFWDNEDDSLAIIHRIAIDAIGKDTDVPANVPAESEVEDER